MQSYEPVRRRCWLLNRSGIRLEFRPPIMAAKTAPHRERTMKKLLAATCLACLIASSGPVGAEDITRFAPLKADQLTPAQKEYADLIAAPPRNAKFGNPPYRAYIRNPELAPKLS